MTSQTFLKLKNRRGDSPPKHVLSDVEGTRRTQRKNSQHEIRNSKQAQMIKIGQTQNGIH